MTRSSVHAICAADHSTSDRGMRLIRILVSIALVFNKSIYAAVPASVESLKTLSLKAASCDKKIMEAVYGSLPESDKGKFKLNFQDEKLTVDNFLSFYTKFLSLDYFECIKSLDLTNLDITNLSPVIFKHMIDLTELHLSGNPNIDLSSEVFKKLCQKLKVLDVSGCNVDEDAFTFICSNCRQLETLILSNNPNINLSSEEFSKICQQLTELDVSNCNIDEDVFDVICSNCPKLKILRVSSNPRINFSKQDLIMFKDTLEELRVDNCDLDAADMLKITGFKSLERLDISNNWLKEYFEGMSGLGDLKNTLTELKASKVGITSENLCKVTECSKITVLDISHNNLKNEENANPTAYRFLGDLADRLTSLNVSRANLNTDQLKEILDSPSIEALDCSCNDFSGLGDTFEIGRAKSVLKNASFSNCYLESPKFLEEILDCQPLVKLDISRNKFEIPCKFAFGSSVSSLKWLDISESEINVKLFIKILGKFEIIEYLDISRKIPTLSRNIDHRPIQFDLSKAVSTIGGLKKSLKTLKASNCKFENDYPFLYSLTDCERLEHLDISGNDLSRLPANFQFGSSREALKYLNMNKCGYISMNTLRAVTDLKVLEILNMNGNSYEMTQERFELGDSKNSLKTISITGSFYSFNSSILQAISECKVLENLDLSISYMDGFEFGSFDFGAARLSLRKINMDGCKTNSEVLLRAVFDCEKLEELNLNRNNLSNLSEDFKLGDSKHSLKVLKMNWCQLRGQNILFEITNCSSLKQLYLSYNNFAVISDDFKFGKSKDTLEIIDMSSCKIQSEKVLSEITDCSNPKELNLSYNNFRNISDDFKFTSSRHSLKVLRMDRCGMINLFTAITSCEVLETLSVRGNSFSSYSFGTSRNTLKDLDISSNSFSGIEDFNQIFDCKRLEKINISYIPLSQFEQELNSESFNMPALKELVAIYCRLTKPSSLRILTSFPKLEKINISSNNFDSFPEGFSLGISKDTLTTITVEDCNFSDRHIIKALTDCKRLEVLMLYQNRGLKECGKVTFGISTNSLKELSLESSKIDLLFWIDEIKKCTKIQKLNLLGNDLSGATTEFDCDGFRDSISDLNINCCGIKGTKILTSLAKYHRLENLCISGCDLQSINLNFKFGNLTYTLKRFSLAKCKNLDPNDKQKILGLFKFLER